MAGDDRLERVTDANFDARAYLVANPDVAAAGIAPREHFELYGRGEGRRQVAGLPRDRDAKYRRFRHVLKAPLDRDPSGTFPIVAGDDHFDLGAYAAESANPGVPEFEREIADNPDKLYLDLGCGRRARTFENCLTVEVYPSVSADLIVSPDCTYPIRDACLDGIGCFAVLEHTRRPWQVVAEMHRMLRPGGTVQIDWPFLQPVHGYPSHFFNATREGLASVFVDAGFRIESAETRINQTPAYTVRWILSVMAERITDPALRAAFEGMTVGELAALDCQSPTWWRFLDAIGPEAMAELAAGNFLVATKTGP